MTIDDESSIYVGGIPYDFTDDSLRRVFDPYGDIVAVKIVNDRGTSGKCYAFVTFRNPRSAVNAMDDMDGRTVGGRVLRVNEVKNKFGNPGFERDGFFPRGSESNRNLDRVGRDRDRDRDRVQERARGCGFDRAQFRDVIGDRSRDHERPRGYDRDRAMDEFWDRDRDQDFDMECDSDRDRNLERDRGLDPDRDRELQRNNEQRLIVMDNHKKSRKRNESITNNGRGEVLSNTIVDHDDHLEEKLQRSTQKLEELKKEILEMEERLDKSEILASELQQKSKKLENSLINAKKTSSYHKTQLTKLHKCFMQVKDYTERAKRSEEQLQSLVNMELSEDIDTIAALQDGL